MSRIRLASLTLALIAFGCGDSPQLNVEQPPAGSPSGASTASAPPPANAPAPAAQPAAAAGQGQLLSGHAPAAAPALPADHPPIGDPHLAAGTMMGGAPMGGVPVVPAGSGEGAAGLRWSVAGDWVAEPPANAMRRAQYRVPGAAGDGECVVFYLGPGQGGDARANAERWASQFVQPDGRPPLAAMKTRNETIDGAAVLIVESTGTYMAGGMMGGDATPKEGWGLLGAIVPGPDADWFFKLTGPAKTVDAQRAAFDSMIRSVRRGG